MIKLNYELPSSSNCVSIMVFFTTLYYWELSIPSILIEKHVSLFLQTRFTS